MSRRARAAPRQWTTPHWPPCSHFCRRSDHPDITGGAPELHPRFRDLTRAARALGIRVIDRCNLTILSEPGQDDLARFSAMHGIDVTASLPCYLEDNVDAQRGDGVYQRSIDGLRRLNARGYGHMDSGRVLNLIYNPQGPALPPPQNRLKPTTSVNCSRATASCSTSSLRSPTCRSNVSGTTLVNNGQFET